MILEFYATHNLRMRLFLSKSITCTAHFANSDWGTSS